MNIKEGLVYFAAGFLAGSVITAFVMRGSRDATIIPPPDSTVIVQPPTTRMPVVEKPPIEALRPIGAPQVQPPTDTGSGGILAQLPDTVGWDYVTDTVIQKELNYRVKSGEYQTDVMTNSTMRVSARFRVFGDCDGHFEEISITTYTDPINFEIPQTMLKFGLSAEAIFWNAVGVGVAINYDDMYLVPKYYTDGRYGLQFIKTW